MNEEKAKRRPGRPRVTICKRGHDQTLAGARTKTGSCVGCNQAREAERKAALPPKVEEPKNAIPEDTIEALCELHALSSKTRGSTPVGHEFRMAGDLLAEMSVNAMSEYGVDVTNLARQMGLSDQTMRFFLMRRGAIPASPGVARNLGAYKNEHKWGRPVVTHCKWGHDISAEGGRYTDGSCRVCKKERGRRYYYGKKDAA